MSIADDIKRSRPGWIGQFTTEQYPGAIPNGTRVIKVGWEPGDAHSMRAKATVLGSLGAPEIGIGYFVEFDEHPKQAVFIAGVKIAEVKQ